MAGFDAQAFLKSIDEYLLYVQARYIDYDLQTPKTLKYDDWIG